MRKTARTVVLVWMCLLNLFYASPAVARTLSETESYGVFARFTHGGLHLVVQNRNDPGLIIIQIDLEYCDGSSGDPLRLNLYHETIDQEFVFIAEKPMKKAQIIAGLPFISYDKAYQVIHVERGCTDHKATTKLFCNHVSLPDTIHRGVYEPISFNSTAFVHRAGLRIPGVDGVIYTQRIHRDLSYHWRRTITYGYRDRHWKGMIPTLKIPVGSYQDVELIVQDGHGNQAKCWVGDLTVLP